MAGRIPQSFIDELLSRIDIVDVIDGYVPLRRAGRNHQARCPFHEEKTPSFTVSQEKQFYHCFGCGANGTAISFLMEYSGMNFVEAIEELATRAGLQVPHESGGQYSKEQQPTELYELMELVVRYYRRQLKEHPQAHRAIDYLKERGLTGEIAAEYEIGFAPPGWENLLTALGTSEDAQQRLTKIGMTLARDSGGHYDRFRDRIMFPIRDQRGRAIGFGGRVLGDDNPKYLNSPETPIFQKGRELYGLYQARKHCRDLQRLYVVEGYMDVLALAQFDIRNAVATLGTAATTDHLEKLFRNTSQLVFCFDGDTAGQKAAWRAMELTLPLLRDGRQAYFMFMPASEDPDSFVRQFGRERFEDQSHFIPLSDYLLDTLKQELDLTNREGRARLIEQSIPYVKKLPASALREMLLEDLAKAGEIGIETIKTMAQAGDQGKPKPSRTPIARQKKTDLSPVRRAIRLLLHQPSLALSLDNMDSLATVNERGIPFLLELLDFIRQRSKTTTADILEHWRDSKYASHLQELATSEEVLSEPDALEIQFKDIICKILTDQEKKHRREELQNIKSTTDLRTLFPNHSGSEKIN